jgi:hypothetical protein
MRWNDAIDVDDRLRQALVKLHLSLGPDATKRVLQRAGHQGPTMSLQLWVIDQQVDILSIAVYANSVRAIVLFASYS